MNWKGTKEKISKDEDFLIACYLNESGEYVANFRMSDEVPIEESEANLDLFIDAVHTIQLCDKLPSELLQQRDEALKLLNRTINALNRGSRSEEARLLHNEHSQLINKIENEKTDETKNS